MADLLNITPIKLNVGSYSSDAVTLTGQLPTGEYLGAFALDAYPYATLLDHWATSFKHNDYQALSGDLTDGVPLSAIASAPRRADVSGQALSAPGLAPWVGRLNDLNSILCELAMKGRTPTLAARLALAKHLPVTKHPMTVWPLRGGKSIDLNLRRVSGGTSITEATLWCIRLTKEAYGDMCDLTDLPHWVVKKLDLSASANETSEDDVTVDPGDSWALRLRAIFAQGHNAADTDSHSETHLNNVLARVRGDDRELLPNIAQDRFRFATLAAAGLQDFDAGRDPKLLIANKRAIRWITETEATTGAKKIFLTHYGTLVPASLVDTFKLER